MPSSEPTPNRPSQADFVRLLMRNEPALRTYSRSLLPDGHLCVTYGYRRKPTGMRARISTDEGKTWQPEIVIRDDGFDGDLGYPRALVRPDGRLFTAYYYNGPREEDRCIEGTFWTPPSVP